MREILFALYSSVARHSLHHHMSAWRQPPPSQSGLDRADDNSDAPTAQMTDADEATPGSASANEASARLFNQPSSHPDGAQKLTVLWYGHVHKIGRSLQAHERVVFVTSASVFVCLPSGGVTRSLLLLDVTGVVRVPPAVAQLVVVAGPAPGAPTDAAERPAAVPGQRVPDLVLAFGCEEDRDNFVGAVSAARLAASRTDEAADRGGPLQLYTSQHYLWDDDKPHGGSLLPSADTAAEPSADGANSKRQENVEVGGPSTPPPVVGRRPRAGSKPPETINVAVTTPAIEKQLDSASGAPSVDEFDYSSRGTVIRGIPSAPNPLSNSSQQRSSMSPESPRTAAGDPLVPPKVGGGSARRIEITAEVNADGSASLVYPGSGVLIPAKDSRAALMAATAAPSAAREGTRPQGLGPSRDAAAVPLASVADGRDVGTRPRKASAISQPPATTQPTANTTRAARAQQPAGGASTSRADADADASSQQHSLPEQRHQDRERQIADIRLAMEQQLPVVDTPSIHVLHDRVDQQQRVIDELKHSSSTAQTMQLQRDLDHCRALMADMQTALRTQEGVFHEMVKAQESQRVAEDLRNVAEKQLVAVTEDRDHLRRLLSAKEEELKQAKDELRAVNDRHTQEMESVRKAFVEYDDNVGLYLESMRQQKQSAGAAGGHHHQSGGGTADAVATSGWRPPQFGAMHGASAAHLEEPPADSSRGGSLLPGLLSLPSHAHATPPPSFVHQGASPPNQQRGASLTQSPPHPYGINPDALTEALLHHLNAYANHRLQLPVAHPVPHGFQMPATLASPHQAMTCGGNGSRSADHCPAMASSSQPLYAPLTPRSTAALQRSRDRSIL